MDDHCVVDVAEGAVRACREPDGSIRVDDRETDESQSSRAGDVQDHRVGIRFAVDVEWIGRVRSESRTLEEKHMLVVRRGDAGITHDQRTHEAALLLAHFIDVCMVNECARSPRSEPRLKRVARRNQRRAASTSAAHARDAIHVAIFDLDPVPVDARRLGKVVHDRDRYGLPAREIDRGTECSPRLNTTVLFLEHEAHRRRGIGEPGVTDRDEPQVACRRRRTDRSSPRAIGDVDAQNESDHATHEGVVRRGRDRVRRQVKREMTVEDPVPWAVGRPRH